MAETHTVRTEAPSHTRAHQLSRAPGLAHTQPSNAVAGEDTRAHIWPHARVPGLAASRLGGILLARARSLGERAALPAAPAPEGGSLPELCRGPSGFCGARGAGAAGVGSRTGGL